MVIIPRANTYILYKSKRSDFVNLKESEFFNSLLMLKMLYGHVYTKEMVLNQCDKFGFRSFNVCVELYKKGYWNGTRRN